MSQFQAVVVSREKNSREKKYTKKTQRVFPNPSQSEICIYFHSSDDLGYVEFIAAQSKKIALV